MNSNFLMTIFPYKYQGVWVFDDERVGLEKEALVAGVPEILERLCVEQGIHDPEKGFALIFSGQPFPTHHLKATWIGSDEHGVGNWYSAYEDMHGWLCPALLKYFSSPPPHLYIQALPTDH